jgi:5-oxopent-3-ene-1,2,5-tricarboxylate decarboxylase/2-hydroxyhepta-2,4-diene-1,7-dioate isomerase
VPIVPERPGKIIAVHLNYEGRMAERGWRPEFPSYFLKPATSVAASGGVLERPAGTELLGFEGEIALIVGTVARRLTPAVAWAHLSGVTAANDFGVFDLRWADRGSNLRAKGGDGFTPLGPAVLDAATVDPTALRLRTWVNGSLRQHATAAELAFPFAELIADLSQLITLEPGDVVLTGTPSGASVAVPGDVVEVEVDVPGGPSTGRLVTRITQGTDALPAYSAPPRVTEQQRAEAWGSRAAAGLAPGFQLTSELRETLAGISVATLSAQLRQRGYNNMSIDGLTPVNPAAKLVGLARTLRFVAFRDDLSASAGGGYNAQKRAFDALHPGDVLVIEARGERGTGTVGDILALRAKTLGAAGIVTDGGVRDYAAVAALDLPVHSAGPHPAVLGRRHVPWDADVTISCGGAAVQPGDVIVGDADGIVVIPPSLAREIAIAAVEQEREEAFIAGQIAAGAAVDGLYPMNAAWRARYEQQYPGDER